MPLSMYIKHLIIQWLSKHTIQYVEYLGKILEGQCKGLKGFSIKLYAYLHMQVLLRLNKYQYNKIIYEALANQVHKVIALVQKKKSARLHLQNGNKSYKKKITVSQSMAGVFTGSDNFVTQICKIRKVKVKSNLIKALTES